MTTKLYDQLINILIKHFKYLTRCPPGKATPITTTNDDFNIQHGVHLGVVGWCDGPG